MSHFPYNKSRFVPHTKHSEPTWVRLKYQRWDSNLGPWGNDKPSQRWKMSQQPSGENGEKNGAKKDFPFQILRSNDWISHESSGGHKRGLSKVPKCELMRVEKMRADSMIMAWHRWLRAANCDKIVFDTVACTGGGNSFLPASPLATAMTNHHLTFFHRVATVTRPRVYSLQCKRSALASRVHSLGAFSAIANSSVYLAW